MPFSDNLVVLNELPKVAVNRLAVLGVNYRTCPIKCREGLALSESSVSDVLSSVMHINGINGCVLLVTCNRCEIIISANDPIVVREQIIRIIENWSSCSEGCLNRNVHNVVGVSAVEYLFRVSSGIDSLVVGEAQILGQLKSAYLRSKKLGFTDIMLNQLFGKAYNVAKRIRKSTSVGVGRVSVASASRQLAQNIFGKLSGSSVMLLGTGEIGVLALRYFYEAGVSKIFVASASLMRAASIAETIDAVPLSLNQVPEFLGDVDVVVGARSINASDGYVIDAKQVTKSLAKRPGRPQLFIDLGVPRNFDSNIGLFADAFLYNIDDIGTVCDQNIYARKAECEKAAVIIGNETEKFQKWCKERENDAVIKEAVDFCDSIREEELRKTIKRLCRANLSADQFFAVREAVEKYGKALQAKLLHKPIVALKDAANLSSSRKSKSG